VGASGWRRKVRRGEGARGSSWAMNSSGDACRCRRLRRGIAQPGGVVAKGKRRGRGRRSRGFIGRSRASI
jgi:hypothetical protein